jgi:hypothetical protein
MTTPYYLAFTDEAQANSVLYTTTVTPEVLDEDGNVITPEVITVTPNYLNIDVLGTVYEPAPDPVPEDYVPVPYPAPNYGVNVLVLESEDPAPLVPYAVTPSPYPQRVWAI